MAAASTTCRPFTPFLHGRQPRRRRVNVAVAAAGTPDAEPAQAAVGAEPGKKKTVDTRIHWSNPDEGWIGGDAKKDGGRSGKKEPLGASFSDLISSASESHYEFLGIDPKADIEEIKAAYRRLSKEYHPDTTTLPLKTASQKFIRLREIYNVLSKEETRRFYDWTLAQEAESRRLQQLRSRLEDPYEQDLQNYESVPDMVDRRQEHEAQRPGHDRTHHRCRHHHHLLLQHHIRHRLQGPVAAWQPQQQVCSSVPYTKRHR